MDVVEAIAGVVSAFALLWIACALERIAKCCRTRRPATGEGGASDASSASLGRVDIEEFVD